MAQRAGWPHRSAATPRQSSAPGLVAYRFQGDGQAVPLDLAALAVGAVTQLAEVHVVSENLALEPFQVFAGGLPELAVHDQAQVDPVRHLQPGVLAGVLDEANEVAGHALAQQFGAKPRVERRQVALLLDGREPLRALRVQQEGFRLEFERFALQLDGGGGAIARVAGDHARVDLLQRLAQRGIFLPSRLPTSGRLGLIEYATKSAVTSR